MRKIILIGFNPLEEAGLRSLLEMMPDCVVIPKDNFSVDSNARADGYILRANIFAENPEYFMTKSGRTCIVFDKLQEGSVIDIRPMKISLDAGYDELSECMEAFINSLEDRPSTIELSNREKDVLRELASGKTNKEIAESLYISVHTVVTHRKNISTKLGVKSISGLSLYALMNGIL